MAKAATTISSTTVIRGRLQGQESIHLDGRIEGQVDIEGQLTVSGTARADAQISAEDVFIDGIVVGDVNARGTIHVTSKAIAAGDLTAEKIIIDDGARVRGFVKMLGTGAPKAAKPTGRTSRPKPTAPPAAIDTDDEPELPDAAATRNVNVKKRP